MSELRKRDMYCGAVTICVDKARAAQAKAIWPIHRSTSGKFVPMAIRIAPRLIGLHSRTSTAKYQSLLLAKPNPLVIPHLVPS
ncbi:hypothetical protein GCM10007094_17200 [Pseudovibrio japonicus]|uniref:Uncharacterized protein n=1 Tax=Pseudovibrio japonicus TaxID=366534 RepID=A0ABQ3EE19_9HYPH|nr:hypothetical protein GCM10007094_17200 [Pseudovibrio japonicus]